MVLTAAHYKEQLIALLPPGPAWSADDGDGLSSLLDGLSQELARIDNRAVQLVDEADPRTTAELFVDWERVAGLPDECADAFGGSQSMSQRRAALLGKLLSSGGQSAPYFVSVAAALGYAIEIIEYHTHDCNSAVGQPVAEAEWAYAWQVSSSINQTSRITVTSAVTEALASWGDSLLECVLNRLKPAHTTIFYVYN